MKSARGSGSKHSGKLPNGDGKSEPGTVVPQAQRAHSQEQMILTFATEKDLEAAIDLLWTEELRDLPHATPDGAALVIPADAVIWLTRAGLKFAAKPLTRIGDLSAEEIRRLRR